MYVKYPNLQKANQNHHEDSIVYYVKVKKQSPNVVDTNQTSPLFFAVQTNNIDLTRLLLKHGADVNLANNKNQTPLNMAVINGNYSLLDLLIRHNASPNSIDKNGYSPLDYARLYGHTRIAKKLLRIGGIGHKDPMYDKNQRLVLQVRLGNLSCVRRLIETKGANFMAKDKFSGKTTLEIAKTFKHKKIINYLEKISKKNK